MLGKRRVWEIGKIQMLSQMPSQELGCDFAFSLSQFEQARSRNFRFASLPISAYF